jgi:DivIVA domain-containing protein
MRKKRRGDDRAGGPEAPSRITPIDIQQKEFRLAFRGYNERDVDVFLDEVTEELARLYAENKRLREQTEFRGTQRLESPLGADAEGILRRAEDERDAILRRAQEEAGRIVAQAELRGSSAGPGGAGGAASAIAGTAGASLVNPFIAREREFLQSLASLIQRHAEDVKEDLRRIREGSSEDSAASAGAAEPPGQPLGGASLASAAEGSGSRSDEGPGPLGAPAGGSGSVVATQIWRTEESATQGDAAEDSEIPSAEPEAVEVAEADDEAEGRFGEEARDVGPDLLASRRASAFASGTTTEDSSVREASEATPGSEAPGDADDAAKASEPGSDGGASGGPRPEAGGDPRSVEALGGEPEFEWGAEDDDFEANRPDSEPPATGVRDEEDRSEEPSGPTDRTPAEAMSRAGSSRYERTMEAGAKISRSAEPRPDDDEEEVRSLRELFWGEN